MISTNYPKERVSNPGKMRWFICYICQSWSEQDMVEEEPGFTASFMLLTCSCYLEMPCHLPLLRRCFKKYLSFHGGNKSHLGYYDCIFNFLDVPCVFLLSLVVTTLS